MKIDPVVGHILGVELKSAHGPPSKAAVDAAEAEADLPTLEQLHVAAIVAPRLRGMRGARKIVTVDKDGKPVREITNADLVKAELVRMGIEFDVPGAPWWTCETCRNMFERGKGTGSTLKQTVCRPCRTPSCPDCGAARKAIGRCSLCHGRDLERRASAFYAICAGGCEKQIPRGGNIAPMCKQCKSARPCIDCGAPRNWYGRRRCSPCHETHLQTLPCRQVLAAEKTRSAPVEFRCPCGNVVSKSTMRPSRVAARGGRPAMCQSCNTKRNGERAPRAKLSDADIHEIRKLSQDGLTGKAIAAKFEVTGTTISRILLGQQRGVGDVRPSKSPRSTPK